MAGCRDGVAGRGEVGRARVGRAPSTGDQAGSSAAAGARFSTCKVSAVSRCGGFGLLRGLLLGGAGGGLGLLGTAFVVLRGLLGGRLLGLALRLFGLGGFLLGLGARVGLGRCGRLLGRLLRRGIFLLEAPLLV